MSFERLGQNVLFTAPLRGCCCSLPFHRFHVLGESVSSIFLPHIEEQRYHLKLKFSFSVQDLMKHTKTQIRLSQTQRARVVSSVPIPGGFRAWTKVIDKSTSPGEEEEAGKLGDLDLTDGKRNVWSFCSHFTKDVAIEAATGLFHGYRVPAVQDEECSGDR